MPVRSRVPTSVAVLCLGIPRLATFWLHRAAIFEIRSMSGAKESPRNSRRGRSLRKRRARDSNPQPLAGHHISSVTASHSLTLRIGCGVRLVAHHRPASDVTQCAGSVGCSQVGRSGAQVRGESPRARNANRAASGIRSLTDTSPHGRRTFPFRPAASAFALWPWRGRRPLYTDRIRPGSRARPTGGTTRRSER
jgi:hypothetical protein